MAGTVLFLNGSGEGNTRRLPRPALFGCGIAIFLALKKAGILRVSAKTEPIRKGGSPRPSHSL